MLFSKNLVRYGDRFSPSACDIVLVQKGDEPVKSILDELYYGNINPNEEGFRRGTPYARALQIIADNEEKLNDLLAKEEKPLLSEMNSAQLEANHLAMVEKFKQGFRLGAKIILSVMLENDEIFTQY